MKKYSSFTAYKKTKVMSNKQIAARNKEEMDATQIIGSRRSKRLILKRDKAKIQSARILSTQTNLKVSTKQGK